MAVPFSTVLPGNLSVCMDNGVLTEAAFPEAYAQLEILYDAGDANIVSMSQHAAEMTTNGGICGRFAIDKATKTFRLPCMPGTYWAGVMAGQNVGDFLIDQMRPITGELQMGTSAGNTAGLHVIPANGAIYDVGPANQRITTSSETVRRPGINSALLGPNYDGARTRPQSIVCDYQMKMYGAVTDAGTIQLAQLIAAMAGKLDTSAFEAWKVQAIMPVSICRFAANGTILSSKNVVSVVRTSAGSWTLTVPSEIFLSTGEMVVKYSSHRPTGTPGSSGCIALSTTTVALRNADAGGNLSDYEGGSVVIYKGA